MTVLLVIAAIVLVVGGGIFILANVDREKVATARRLKLLAAPPATKMVGDKRDQLKTDPWLPYVPSPIRPWVQDKLASTGYAIPLRLLLLIGVGGGFVMSIASLIVGFSMGGALFVLFFFMVVPPFFIIRYLQGRHTARFLDQFPDAIDLIVRAVRAGLPVMGALDATGRETPDPVGSEFRLITADLRIGLEFDEALHRADARIRLADFSFFVASLVLQRESGGNLSETLSILSAVLRRRRELRMKIAAMTSEAKTSAMVIASLPFVASGALAIMNPPYVNTFFIDPKGPWILGVAGAMLGLGWLTMKTLIENAVR
jgi:tight adherence protein B